VELPPCKPVKTAELFPYKGADAKKPDWNLVKSLLLKEGKIDKKDAAMLC